MPEIKVGSLYREERTEYPEGSQYNLYDGGHELLLLFADPNRREIESVRKGKASFGLLVEEEIIFLLFKFQPELNWSDAPYCWWMVPEERRSPPFEIAEGQGALLQIILLDAKTGIVHAIRAIGLPTDFSRALHQAIQTQMQHPITPQEYSDRVDRVFARYPNTMAMVQSPRALIATIDVTAPSFLPKDNQTNES